MKMSGLAPLYRSMRSQQLERVKFPYQVNHLSFDCLFFIDTQPFELVMGCLARNFAIFLEVQRGFEVDTFLDEATFYALRHGLRNGANSTNHLQTSAFFAEFNCRIPSLATAADVPQPHEVGIYYPRLERGDERYFMGWLDNTAQGHQVSPENLEKTQRLMGHRAHEFSLRRN